MECDPVGKADSREVVDLQNVMQELHEIEGMRGCMFALGGRFCGNKLVPDMVSDTAWWKLWGVLGLLHKRPSILVYAREATFALWSGVLESGGYDVIVEPFSDAEIRDAVRQAGENFDERSNGF